jgi:hypothetical protein
MSRRGLATVVESGIVTDAGDHYSVTGPVAASRDKIF